MMRSAQIPLDSRRVKPPLQGQAQNPSLPPLDKFFWLAVVMIALVVIPRSILITQAHSPTMDDQFHLRRGLLYLTDQPANLRVGVQDGPLGDALDAVPMVLTGSTMMEPIHRHNLPDHGADDWIPRHENPVQRLGRVARMDVLFGHALSPDALLMLIAIWHAVLFIPFAAIAFHWVRGLYGLASGWVALAMLLIDPSIAAFIPIASIDMFGVEGIVIACFCVWLYVRKPTVGRLVGAAVACAAALLIKQTAIAIPVVVIGYALLWWVVLPWWERRKTRCCAPPPNKSELQLFSGGAQHRVKTTSLRLIVNRLALFFLIFLFFIWALMKFDYSRPLALIQPVHNPIINAALEHRWPAGRYIEACITSLRIDATGRWAYLLGQARVGGWWYYYPVLLAFKTPLGFFVIFALAIWSLRRRRPFFAEWSLVLPIIIWGALLLTSRINIGFRHFLPEYALLLLLASRSLIDGKAASTKAPRHEESHEEKEKSSLRSSSCFSSRLRVFVVAVVLAFSAGSALAYHPDYLSYVNYPYAKPWLLMSDSNLDWGQGLKEVRQYLDDHPTNRPVYIRYDWGNSYLQWYLGNRVHVWTQHQTQPRHGLLIISPVWVAGYWDPLDAYGALRSRKPIAVIGHSMLVYDLDQLFSDPDFSWANR